MVQQQPRVKTYDAKILADTETLKSVVAGIRTIRLEKNIPNKVTLSLEILKGEPSVYDCLICKMANIGHISKVDEKSANAATFRVGLQEFAVPVGDLVDKDEERKKLEAELQHLRGFREGILKKLGNENFISRAPAQVVEMERKKLSDAESKIKAIEESLKG